MNLLNRLKAACRMVRDSPSELPRQPNPDWRPNIASSQPGELLIGKTVLISGAGPNIGKSLAVEMGKQGAKIIFIDLDRSWITELENHLQAQGVSCEGFAFDVRNKEDIDGLCALLDQKDISLDVVVHNAKLEYKNSISLLDFDLHEWVQTYHTNVFGPLYLTKCVVERMRSRGQPASIIFLTSICQFNPCGRTSYSSSKAALGMIVKELAIELGAYRIRVNGIAPSWAQADELGMPKPNKFAPLYKTSIPPKFIGRAAVYLASDYFSYCTTGTVLTVDGGVFLYNHHSEELSRKRKML